MTFAEMVALVMQITTRVDKEIETVAALNGAMNLFSFKATFQQDHRISLITVPSACHGVIDLPGAGTPPITRFRKISYVRSGYNVLTFSSLENVYTPSGYVQPDRFAVAGNQLLYYTSCPTTQLEIGYFQHAPTLTTLSTETFWMMDLMPMAIVYEAASTIFRSIGDDSSAATHKALSSSLFEAAVSDFQYGILPTAVQ